MTEPRPGARPARSGGRAAWQLAAAILAAGALSGCAIQWGGSPESEDASARPTFKEQNSLYLQEQELRARERNQQSGPTVPDRF